MTPFEQWRATELLRIELTFVRDRYPQKHEYFNSLLQSETKRAQKLMNQMRNKSRARVVYRLDSRRAVR
jgi:hypothetical protein